MNDKEREWLEQLKRDRSNSAHTLEKPSMRGIQSSVVDKYSDQAHFIYELLQNSDDAKATLAHFRLETTRLVFTHNGSVRFTISDPQNEESDTKDGTLGHINAITSIANSNKSGSSIGKFGVGFKAVFQYTQTPHIYDPNIQFKIERFIVPHMLDSDLEGRKSPETAFLFPFDHKKKQPQESHDEILEKLKALEFPVLFLSNLQSVSFEAEEVTGKYTKQVTRTLEHGDITVEWLTLTLALNGTETVQRLVMFTRNNASGHPCSIGYALAEDEHLVPIDRSAFCFFPTREATNLNFILHAPFLLTDSREGIKAGEKHNQELIQQLAQLAADSLPILRDEQLIDDGILYVIPCDATKFSMPNDRIKISFFPFFSAIKNKLQTDSLLPAASGEYSHKRCSYWASDAELVELFTDEQLAYLTYENGASWVFRSLDKKNTEKNPILANYIDGFDACSHLPKEPNLIRRSLDPEFVLNLITAGFIAAQPPQWLHTLYAYLSDRPSYLNFVKRKPIFLDQDGTPAPAFDDKDQAVLFLPDDDLDGLKTVNKALLTNEASRAFIGRLGVKKPSLRDEIYNNRLRRYTTDEAPDTTSDFKVFFRYFKDSINKDVVDFIKLLTEVPFLACRKEHDTTDYQCRGNSVYLPTPELKEWFETKPDTFFLSLDKYRDIVGEQDHATLDAFLDKLGAARLPRVLQNSYRVSDKDLLKWVDENLSTNGHSHTIIESHLDGLTQIIADITPQRSVVLWRLLATNTVLHSPSGVHTWKYYSDHSECYPSQDHKSLREKSWILNKAGKLVTADAVTIQSLSDQYDTTSGGAKALIALLGIRDHGQRRTHLTEDETRKIRLAEEIEQSGLSEDEILTAIEDAKRKKADQPSTGKSGGDTEQTLPDSTLIQEIAKRRPSVKNGNSSGLNENDSPEPGPSPDTNEDADDYTPKAVDYGKTLDRAKDRYASELDRIEREQSLHDKANALPRYSYGWFLALLELECMASSDKNADSKTISISFGKVEQDIQSSRTIVLKEPSRFIPQSIEEFSGVRVDLDFGNGRTGKLRIESFTAKEFSLFGKLESAGELDGIDLGEVLEARIELQNPSFLLQELLERFRELMLDESFDMQANLTPDIEFVFGPPGTGKTTHLAQNVLLPRMSDTKKARVLVLTPTNKAADVLTTRIMEKMDGDTSYRNWLVRFGTSAEENIEKAGVWRDRSFDIGGLNRSVTVTTIARFAYDGFAGEHGKKLCEMKWDVVVFDEASMISLASIIYPLYRQKPQKFIVAGDPFQIEPIVAVDQWKNENIYTLVGLNRAGSFAEPATEPHNYPVTNLEIQYRSIPAIGDVFSRFTYDGILKHHRAAGAQRPLKLNGFDVKPINLIKFPVSKYESIYRAKRLESGTPYQTYSALFTFEFVRWLALQILGNVEKKVRIGVIAPYRAQANVLSRLNDSWATKPDAVEIQVGTIHGFQGDECDIIIAVLNPPPAISRNPQMFLNKQNILNVAISRARDYLFIVMPDDETEDVDNLHKIAKIETLVKSGGAFSEYASRIVEEMI